MEWCQPARDESLKDRRRWKSDGLVRDMGWTNCPACFHWHQSECWNVPQHARRHSYAIPHEKGRQISGVLSAWRGAASLWCLRPSFPGHWIGRRGPVEWPLRSPDLIPLDFWVWRHLNAMVCQVKIQNIDHLKERIRDTCSRITTTVLKRVRNEWERRIRMC